MNSFQIWKYCEHQNIFMNAVSNANFKDVKTSILSILYIIFFIENMDFNGSEYVSPFQEHI
jgi:hypothetical protein